MRILASGSKVSKRGEFSGECNAVLVLSTIESIHICWHVPIFPIFAILIPSHSISYMCSLYVCHPGAAGMLGDSVQLHIRLSIAQQSSVKPHNLPMSRAFPLPSTYPSLLISSYLPGAFIIFCGTKCSQSANWASIFAHLSL